MSWAALLVSGDEAAIECVCVQDFYPIFHRSRAIFQDPRSKLASKLVVRNHESPLERKHSAKEGYQRRAGEPPNETSSEPQDLPTRGENSRGPSGEARRKQEAHNVETTLSLLATDFCSIHLREGTVTGRKEPFALPKTTSKGKTILHCRFSNASYAPRLGCCFAFYRFSPFRSCCYHCVAVSRGAVSCCCARESVGRYRTEKEMTSTSMDGMRWGCEPI